MKNFAHDSRSVLRQGGETAAAHAYGNWLFGLLLLYMVLEYARPQNLVPVIAAIRPSLIVSMILILFSLSQIGKGVFAERHIRWTFAFLVLIACSVFYATNNYWAFEYTKLTFTYLFAAMIPMHLLIRSLDRYKTFFWWWVALHLFIAIFCILNEGKGPGSFVRDENDVALVLNACIPFAYVHFRQEKVRRLRRMLLGAIVVLLVVGVVVTGSRGGFLGLVAILGWLVWTAQRRLKLIGIFLGLSTLFIALAPKEYLDEIISIGDATDGTRIERVYSWHLALEVFADNPVVGVGAGNFAWRVGEYEVTTSADYGQRRVIAGRVAHSTYFTLISETGLIGTVIYLSLIIGFFKSLARQRERLGEQSVGTYLHDMNVAAGLAMASFLVSATFITSLYYPTFWYLLTFAALTVRMQPPNSIDRESSTADRRPIVQRGGISA